MNSISNIGIISKIKKLFYFISELRFLVNTLFKSQILSKHFKIEQQIEEGKIKFIAYREGEIINK